MFCVPITVAGPRQPVLSLLAGLLKTSTESPALRFNSSPEVLVELAAALRKRS